MKKGIAILTMVAMSAWALAGSVDFKSADQGVAFRIKNTGTLAATYKAAGVTTVTNTVIIGSCTNTPATGATVDTLTELAAWIEARTNTSGQTVLKVERMGLDADSTDQEILAGTYSITANNGTADVLWDTSQCKFYSLYLPKGNLRYVYGAPIGTGSLTLKVYASGTLVFNDLIAAAQTNTGALVEQDFGGVGLPSGGRNLVRFLLGTTATTGNIGAVTVD